VNWDLLRWLPSERRAYRDQQSLESFRNAFVGSEDHEPDRDALRRQLIAEAAAAERAVRTSLGSLGADPVDAVARLTRPGALTELATTMGTVQRGILDDLRPDVVAGWLEVAARRLEEHRSQLRRRHLNPFLWIDALLRTILRAPLYVYSLIVDVPVSELETKDRVWLLRLAGVIALGGVPATLKLLGAA
jgi:hypothetical protein